MTRRLLLALRFVSVVAVAWAVAATWLLYLTLRRLSQIDKILSGGCPT